MFCLLSSETLQVLMFVCVSFGFFCFAFLCIYYTCFSPREYNDSFMKGSEMNFKWLFKINVNGGQLFGDFIRFESCYVGTLFKQQNLRLTTILQLIFAHVKRSMIIYY